MSEQCIRSDDGVLAFSSEDKKWLGIIIMISF